MSVLVEIHVYTKLKVKTSVTICQTINEITDRLTQKFCSYVKKVNGKVG